MFINFSEHPVLLEALYIIETLEEAGHSAYIVGGAVRDVLLARPIQDVDIATSAKPEETKSLFKKVFDTGLQHGTITVVHKRINYEVTTYRVESDYRDFRRPAQVSFVQELKQDLSRRDFTMNAMAINRHGELIDYFGGQTALETNTLVAVGHAEKRFQEDALRMLRAIRFATNYGLSCDESLWHAIQEHRPLLNHIAMERVAQELNKLTNKTFSLNCLELLYQSGLMNFTKQHISLQAALTPLFDSGSPSIVDKSVMAISFEKEVWFWSFVYYQANFSDEQIRMDLNGLVFPKKTSASIRKHIAWLRVLHETMQAQKSESTITGYVETMYPYYERYMLLFDEKQQAKEVLCSTEGVLLLLKLYWIEQLQMDEDARLVVLASFLQFSGLGHMITILTDIEASIVIYRLKDLDVTGKELSSAFALEAGPWLKSLLQYLFMAVNMHRVKNEKNTLLQYASWLSNKE